MVSLNKTNFKRIVKLYINNPDKLVLNGNGKHFFFLNLHFFFKDSILSEVLDFAAN